MITRLLRSRAQPRLHYAKTVKSFHIYLKLSQILYLTQPAMYPCSVSLACPLYLPLYFAPVYAILKQCVVTHLFHKRSRDPRSPVKLFAALRDDCHGLHSLVSLVQF